MLPSRVMTCATTSHVLLCAYNVWDNLRKEISVEFQPTRSRRCKSKWECANGSRPMMTQEPDPQVVPKAERRRFSAEYKLRILAEADRLQRAWPDRRTVAAGRALLIASDDVASATGARHTGSETRAQAGPPSSRGQAACSERTSGCERDWNGLNISSTCKKS